jgi:hypothetical protein
MPILEKEVTSQIQIMNNLLYFPDKASTRQRLAEIREKSDAALASVLTPEQYAKYQTRFKIGNKKK